MDNEEGESKPKPFVRTHGPISSNRHNLPLRTLPPSVDVPRSGTIEHLLRREFGTLAPPPAPSVSGGSIMQDALERQARIKARRDEYQAMDADSLQKLVEEARDKERKELEERIEALRANREGAWPAWAAQDLWSENEFASICCGLLPNESRTDSLASQVSQASESISRGVLSKTLQFIPRSDADTAAFMYGTARHF
ncbi:MAG: hypothetical protein KGL91_03180, partial [Xanthomonadaceae bacterium]|nr:hypothetical protein [Xanthomonadaceae bacterium]